MKILSAIIGGLLSAILIKLFSKWFNKKTGKDVDLVWYIGRLAANIFRLPGPAEKWHTIGYVLYYIIAVMIAILYQMLWSVHIGEPNIFFGLLFGFLSGLVGLTIWRVILMKSYNPPYVPIKFYAVNYLTAYILFGLTVVLIWRLVYWLLRAC